MTTLNASDNDLYSLILEEKIKQSLPRLNTKLGSPPHAPELLPVSLDNALPSMRGPLMLHWLLRPLRLPGEYLRFPSGIPHNTRKSADFWLRADGELFATVIDPFTGQRQYVALHTKGFNPAGSDQIANSVVALRVR